ncbi:MAG: hypothetical protein K2N52_05110, partial [Clostridia bacterium]|nr:hypothetical protein [Clostridia bacterium]
MTAKQFFKSNVFKCLVTLLCILLVCGIFLTVAYAFLKVTDEEKLNRAISKIYGRTVSVTALNVSNEDAAQGKATILEVYEDEDGNYLLKSKGSGGFGGTITCWVLVCLDNGAVSSVEKVVIESSDGETFLNKINYLDKFANTSYTDGFEYSTDNGFVTIGASMSSAAINNSVNGAVAYVRYVILNETAVDPYADYAFHDYIDMEKTSWVRSGDTLTYNIVTKSNPPARAFEIQIAVTDGIIDSYEITTSGSTAESYDAKINTSLFIGKDVDYFKGIIGEDGSILTKDNYEDNEIATGATKSNYLCLAAGAFATANYDYILTLVYFTDYIDLDNSSWALDGDTVTYNIVTKKNAPAQSFEIQIAVTNGIIYSYEITSSGSTAESYDAKINTALFVGKNVHYLKGIIGNDGSILTKDNYADNGIATGA